MEKNFKRILAFVFVLVLCMTAMTSALAETEAEYIKKTIKDPRILKAVINAVGGEANLTGENIRKIETLAVTDKGIQELEGIQMLTGLKNLDLSGNNLEVIAQLSSLSKLEKLDLSGNAKLREIAPLGGDAGGNAFMPNLKELDLSGTGVENIAPLCVVTSLEVLDLSDNGLEDIRPLSTLTKMKILDLSNNDLEELAPLYTLTNLEKLDLSSNKIADTRPLVSLKKLKVLDASDNLIENLAYINKLTGLTSLDLSNNPATKVDVSKLPKTGDSSNLMLWMGILVISMAAFAASKKVRT